MAPETKHYTTKDSIPKVLEVVARCRTCGEPYTRASAARDQLPGFCPAHDLERLFQRQAFNDAEAILGRVCCRLQDFVIDRTRELCGERSAYGKLEAATTEQRWWYETITTTHTMCTQSLIWLLPDLQGLWYDQGMLKIHNIEELQFYTGEYYNYIHCAVVIQLQNGDKYVFDPTGVQFGPEWALLSRFDEYMEKNYSDGLREIKPLGTMADCCSGWARIQFDFKPKMFKDRRYKT